jgi:dipeptidyl aminopeptidase/acylaminoacyl peptidase
MLRVLLLAAVGAGSALAEAPAQNGKLIDDVVIQFPESALTQIETNFPGTREILKSVQFHRITYLSDGLKVNGYLAAPKHGERLPCVIFNRGGNREFGALRRGPAAALLGRMASWGFVVVASQYRGNDGGEGREEFGGADVNDVLNLIPLLQSWPHADASRVGMYGWSRGGMMTYLALTRMTNIAAAVIGAGPTDQLRWPERRPDMETNVFAELIPGYATNRDPALRARSALYWPEKLHKQTPILLLHGSADWRVDPTDSLRMATALFEQKHPFRLVFFEGGDHGLSEYSDEVNQLVRDWLDRYVRDRKSWPSLEPHGP